MVTEGKRGTGDRERHPEPLKRGGYKEACSRNISSKVLSDVC